MKQTAFIWRKSIYDNSFLCNVCGTKLFNPKNGKLYENNVGFVPGNSSDLFCMKCKNYVAKIKEIDCEGTETLRGEWKGADSE